MSLEFVDRAGSDCSKWDGVVDKFGEEDVIPLWVADMDFAAPECVQSALIERARHPVYAYTLYSKEFFEAIVRWYGNWFGWEIRPEWIVPEHGVVVSLNISINEYSSEGDGIIVQTPIYPPFMNSIRQNKRKFLENRLIMRDGRVSIDFDDFESKAKEAKLFLLCSPHNPTGRSWSNSELQKLLDICIKHDVLVISDEIHSDLVFEKKHVPIGILSGARERVVTLHAPSKTFNIAGLNTSYAIIPSDKLRRRYIYGHDRAGLDNGNVFGITALKAAYNSDGVWLKSLKEQLKENCDYVKNFILSNIPVITLYEHDATFLLWLDCSGLNMNDDELSKFFINNAKLGLNSGYSFGEAGSGFMRLNIGTSKEILRQAMQKLYSAIEQRTI